MKRSCFPKWNFVTFIASTTADMMFTAREREDVQYLKVLIAQGDETAFRKLFGMFFTNLSQFAFSLLKSKEAATEVTDEVFIRLWKNRTAIITIHNLKVYLYQAIKNASLNYLSRKAHLSTYEPFDDISIELRDDYSPEKLMVTKEMSHKISEVVNALPPRCKMIFKLVREDGLKYKEVADILNLSVKTVDAQMVIAISRIREMLKGHLDMSFKKISQKN